MFSGRRNQFPACTGLRINRGTLSLSGGEVLRALVPVIRELKLVWNCSKASLRKQPMS
jgi:hypothetical protein